MSAATSPALLALASVGAIVVFALVLLALCALGAVALDGCEQLRRRFARRSRLDAARAAYYAEIDRVAVVSQLGDEVDANVFPLPRRAAAEVVPFPTRPAA